MSSETQQQEWLKEQAKYQAVLSAIQDVIATKPGKVFVKYLLENFEVGEMPAVGLSGDMLMDRLGFLRAGTSIFDLISNANPEISAQLLAQIKKEKYDSQRYYDTVDRK